MKRALMFCIFLLCASMSFAQHQTLEFVVDGNGPTRTVAIATALRSALEQSYGLFISSDTRVLNDELVTDEIATISSGFIKSYEVLDERVLPSGDWTVSVLARPSLDRLRQFAKTYVSKSGESVRVDFSEYVVQKELERIKKENHDKVCYLLVEQSRRIAREPLFDVSIESIEQERDNPFWVSLDWGVYYNDACDLLYDLWDRTLRGMGFDGLREAPEELKPFFQDVVIQALSRFKIIERGRWIRSGIDADGTKRVKGRDGRYEFVKGEAGDWIINFCDAHEEFHEAKRGVGTSLWRLFDRPSYDELKDEKRVKRLIKQFFETYYEGNGDSEPRDSLTLSPLYVGGWCKKVYADEDGRTDFKVEDMGFQDPWVEECKKNYDEYYNTSDEEFAAQESAFPYSRWGASVEDVRQACELLGRTFECLDKKSQICRESKGKYYAEEYYKSEFTVEVTYRLYGGKTKEVKKEVKQIYRFDNGKLVSVSWFTPYIPFQRDNEWYKNYLKSCPLHCCLSLTKEKDEDSRSRYPRGYYSYSVTPTIDWLTGVDYSRDYTFHYSEKRWGIEWGIDADWLNNKFPTY